MPFLGFEMRDFILILRYLINFTLTGFLQAIVKINHVRVNHHTPCVYISKTSLDALVTPFFFGKNSVLGCLNDPVFRTIQLNSYRHFYKLFLKFIFFVIKQ
ncbi:hypothetical protein SAMN05428971_2473 [Candidatus Pantoea varia]|uniref:Uncharacterized protein n=1 Tax=Candidatus Pantoea varia TaxID=1881036 RepID=A0A1I5CUL7_9GAMM|nr:hypothetical protein SAMN05428971_2473 [Pantoea varia]